MRRDLRGTEQSSAAQVGTLGKQGGVDLDPDAPLRVTQGNSMMRTRMPYLARHADQAGAEQAGLDPFELGLRYQNVQIPHGPKVGDRIVLMADGDALEESRTHPHALAGIDDFDSSFTEVPEPDLGREIGA